MQKIKRGAAVTVGVGMSLLNQKKKKTIKEQNKHKQIKSIKDSGSARNELIKVLKKNNQKKK